ncbi:MAG: endopeptidase La [Clostridiaceae bacterium]|nr:endopeptidase La [Clostridiaceae bacterium]
MSGIQPNGRLRYDYIFTFGDVESSPYRLADYLPEDGLQKDGLSEDGLSEDDLLENDLPEGDFPEEDFYPDTIDDGDAEQDENSVLVDRYKRYRHRIFDSGDDNSEDGDDPMSDEEIGAIFTDELILPCVPLRGMSPLPHITISLDIARRRSKAAVMKAMDDNLPIFLIAQRDLNKSWPKESDLYTWGCVARILDIDDGQREGALRVLVGGVDRAELVSFYNKSDFALAKVRLGRAAPLNEDDKLRLEVYKRDLLDRFFEYIQLTRKVPRDLVAHLALQDDFDLITNFVAATLELELEQVIDILGTLDLVERYTNISEILEREIKMAEYRADLMNKVHSSISQDQREYFLREEMRVIRDELGEGETTEDEVAAYLKLLAKTPIPDAWRERLEKEINKLNKYPPAFPEASVQRNYLDLVFELPWGKEAHENHDIAKARRQLDRDHYGLEYVKERILEYLAVRKLQAERENDGEVAPILCLVGPPGVGKTSVARSIATALRRRYVQFSLGGVRDEAEIRGHRRTYIGAMPGRIIQSMRQAKVSNPLILLDEIDKLGSDFRGDPSSALLEALDPAQNDHFMDHYLDIPFDLSKVLFITTANDAEAIPPALLDRMEMIRLNGYTQYEKERIARRHLLPRQLKKHSLTRKEMHITDSGLNALIRGYTREAGVRQLERELARLCRKAALEIGEKQGAGIRITAQNIGDYLGLPKYYEDELQKINQIGVVTGLAWTAVGGETMSIEVNRMPGTGKLEMTGQLGEVMQESAKVALAYLRAHSRDFGIEDNFYKDNDIHIHIPEGAVPKDGPSAGVTLATGLVSVFTGRPVRSDIAMTGELTTHGRVLPIGGLKEKLIAADRAGITRVLIPQTNKRELSEMPDSVLKRLEIMPVRTIDEVLSIALDATPREE